MSINVTTYSPEMQPAWNAFVDASRNATFLLRRDYMDYHSARFVDHSLCFSDSAGRLVALLPACLTDDRRTLSSHAGLTYGGLILPPRHCSPMDTLDVFDTLRAHCLEHGITSLIYKAIPYFYHRLPAQDDLYTLFRNNAQTECVNLSMLLDTASSAGPDMTCRQNIRKAVKQGVTVVRSDDYATFWTMLEACLAERHDARPVHSLDEMQLLASRFPDAIRLYLARDAEGTPLAGTILYLSHRCAHSQYIATTPLARTMRALPLLLQHTIEDCCNSLRHYYDFGTCNEQQGRVLNAGLVEQKGSFGATAATYATYRVTF